jgi:hypothetical protein
MQEEREEIKKDEVKRTCIKKMRNTVHTKYYREKGSAHLKIYTQTTQ